LLGLSGKLDADLRLRGADPETATLLGSVVIRDGTLPIADTIGVVRDATAAFTFQPGRASLTVDGTIVAGTVHVEADATLDGVLPRRGSLRATAEGIELIMSSAPRVDGTLTAEVERQGDRWKVTAAIRRGSVTSRVTSERELHPSDMPDDLVFASTAPGARPPVPPARQVKEFIGDAPSKPFLDIILRVQGVAVDVPQLRGDVGGRVDVSIGADGALIEGKLEVVRGDVIVLERRYRLRRAVVTFDGGLDPLLDLQLERELPELTLFANITGRASDPELELASDPPTYTQGQLLAFALSDTASAAGSETSDAASNLFAAVASQAIVGAISPILPVRLDLIAYEPATASSSRAFVFGHWLTRRLLVLYRNRTEARVDENVNEAEIEYWLGRRVLFEGVAGDRGILGADLLWTRRW
ncbi:MAG: translocation/assembly module TamB, partial [Deltaproteobacteria bacterium]|nr:translocation/assembly module TamB [Kofleriaceae bacterium]